MRLNRALYRLFSQHVSQAGVRSSSRLPGLSRSIHGGLPAQAAEAMSFADSSEWLFHEGRVSFDSPVGRWQHLPREEILRSPEIYQRRIQNLGDQNRGYKIRDIWEEMELNGVQPTEVLCLLALYHSMKSRRLNDAAFYFAQLKTHGHKPSVRAYAYMISACGRCGQLDLAYKYLAEMQAAGLTVNTDIYMAVMNGLGEKGSWEEAEALFAEVVQLEVHTHESHYSALLQAYGRASNVPVGTDERIMELLDESRDADTHSFSRSRPGGLGVLALTPAIRSLANLGYHERVMELFGDMHEEGVEPDLGIFSSIISSLARNAAGHYRQPDPQAKTLVVTRLKGILGGLRHKRKMVPRSQQDAVSIESMLEDDPELAESLRRTNADPAMLQSYGTAGHPHLGGRVVPQELLEASIAAWPCLSPHHVHNITPAAAAQLCIHAATARPDSFDNAVGLWRSVMARQVNIAPAAGCELVQCAVHMNSIGVPGAEDIGREILETNAAAGQYLNIVQGSFLLSLASRPQSWSLDIAGATWDCCMRDAKTPNPMACQDYLNLLQRKGQHEPHRIHMVRDVIQMEEGKKRALKQENKGPRMTARQITKLRQEPAGQKEPAWKLMQHRKGDKPKLARYDWLPASTRPRHHASQNHHRNHHQHRGPRDHHQNQHQHQQHHRWQQQQHQSPEQDLSQNQNGPGRSEMELPGHLEKGPQGQNAQHQPASQRDDDRAWFDMEFAAEQHAARSRP